MIDQNEEICRICKQWGVGYVGSKNKHLKWLFSHLPAGQRFIDLFGGGFAVSHYAYELRRYPIVVYSDCNPYIVKLIQKAAAGDYDIGRFVPDWIDRETFNRVKDDLAEDPYIKYVFSYSCDGEYYLGSENSTFYKIWRGFYDYLYLNTVTKDLIDCMDEDFNELNKHAFDPFCDKYRWATAHCFHDGKNGIHSDLMRIIKSGKAARKCVIMQRNYDDYQYREGDIVYCDIPYYQTALPYQAIDYDRFYSWARKTPCFISEYSMPYDFFEIDKKECRTTRNDNYRPKRIERLFASPAAIREGVYEPHNQLCFNWGRDNPSNPQRDTVVDDISEECGYRADIKGFGTV